MDEFPVTVEGLAVGLLGCDTAMAEGAGSADAGSESEEAAGVAEVAAEAEVDVEVGVAEVEGTLLRLEVLSLVGGVGCGWFRIGVEVLVERWTTSFP